MTLSRSISRTVGNDRLRLDHANKAATAVATSSLTGSC